MLRTFLFLLASLVLTSSSHRAVAQTPDSQVADATTSAAAPDASDNDKRRARVYAKVGATEITVGDLEDQINQRSPFVRRRMADKEALQKFVDDLVQAELMAQGAKRAGMEAHPKVQRFVGETIVQMFVRQEFDQKNTPGDIKSDKIKAYYKANPDEFNSPEMRRASHILLDTKAEADALVAELSGTDPKRFAQAAKDKSVDTETKLRGGDLLFFSKDGRVSGNNDAPVDASLVAAAFSLKEVGDLKTAAVGEKWSVVKLTGLRNAQSRSLEDATTSIRRRIWRKERRETLETLLAKLREDLKPESHPERVEPIVVPPPPPGAIRRGDSH